MHKHKHNWSDNAHNTSISMHRIDNCLIFSSLYSWYSKTRRWTIFSYANRSMFSLDIKMYTGTKIFVLLVLVLLRVLFKPSKSCACAFACVVGILRSVEEVKAKSRDTFSLSNRHSDNHILSGNTQIYDKLLQWVPTDRRTVSQEKYALFAKFLHSVLKFSRARRFSHRIWLFESQFYLWMILHSEPPVSLCISKHIACPGKFCFSSV